MSRSGYIDDMYDQWDFIRWRGAVKSAIRGKRGQAFLKEMLAALDALPEPKLIAHELEQNGAVCALGSVGVARGINMDHLDPEDRETVAAAFAIPHAMACEIFHENDEAEWFTYWNDCYWTTRETPDERFTRMRKWVVRQIRADATKDLSVGTTKE